MDDGGSRADRDAARLRNAVDVDEYEPRRFRKATERFVPEDNKRGEKRKRDGKQAVVPQSEPTMEVDGLMIDGDAGRRPSRRQQYICVKHEAPDDGLIRCPSCGNGIVVSERGCNMVACRAEVHRPGYFYFCFHCRRDLGRGMPCQDCPERNDRESRSVAKVARNERNRLNPISLDCTTSIPATQSGICEHGRQRSRCKECGGGGICEHGRDRKSVV